MTTNTALITNALREPQIIADGQTASASELAIGLKELNNMMAMWAVDDKDIGYFPQDTGSDTCPIPIWSEQAVQSNLSINLCAVFKFPVSTETAKRAIEGANFIAKMVINSKLEGANMDTMPLGSNSVRKNILTDNY